MHIDRHEIKVNQSALKFIIIKAVKKLFNCEVQFPHSLDKGLYTRIVTPRVLTADDIVVLKDEIKSIIDEGLPFNKKIVTKNDAYNYYLSLNYEEKAENIKNQNTKTITLHELDGAYNDLLSDLPNSTKEVSVFEIAFLGKNDFVLLFPIKRNDTNLIYKHQDKIFESFKTYGMWSKTLQVKYVSDLNKIVAENKIDNFIRKNDIMVEHEFYTLSKQIKDSNKRVILVGGPSSSGKTTSTKKLALNLSNFGINPIYIGMDDYFRDRVETPIDNKGNPDFESLKAVDVEFLNEQLIELLEGKDVNLPSYNFKLGEREFKNRIIKMKENDVLLVEGLHCLNEELTHSINKADKFKVYLSPFIPLSIDRHNHISTVDLRLIRRLVRDSWSRNYSVEDTMKQWEHVRIGESQHIFPFIDEADVVFNTSFIYEVGVLKVYAEPLLFNVGVESKYYSEARRLLDFLQMFFPVPSEYVKDDNVLREFIGGSCVDKEIL